MKQWKREFGMADGDTITTRSIVDSVVKIINKMDRVIA